MNKYIFGILILLFGVYFLLENLGYQMGLGDMISTYWPIIVVLYGAKMMFKGLINFYKGFKKRHWHTGNILWGAFIAGIGIALLGNKLGWFSIGLKEFWNITWPLLIIFFGLSILFRSQWKNREIFFEIDTDKKKYTINRRKHFIGETTYGDGSAWNLEDLHLWHGIGSSFIDLTTAIVPDRETYIDISGLIGEVTVLVPQGLPAKVNVDVRIGEVTVFNHNQGGTGRFIAYTSDGYEDATRKVNIMISLSIGEVTVKQVY